MLIENVRTLVRSGCLFYSGAMPDMKWILLENENVDKEDPNRRNSLTQTKIGGGC